MEPDLPVPPANAPTQYLYKIYPMNAFSGTHWFTSYIQYQGENFIEDDEHTISRGEALLADIRDMISAHLILHQNVTVQFIIQQV